MQLLKNYLTTEKKINKHFLFSKKNKHKCTALNILCFVHAVFEEFIECLKKKN